MGEETLPQETTIKIEHITTKNLPSSTEITLREGDTVEFTIDIEIPFAGITMILQKTLKITMV